MSTKKCGGCSIRTKYRYRFLFGDGSDLQSDKELNLQCGNGRSRTDVSKFYNLLSSFTSLFCFLVSLKYKQKKIIKSFLFANAFLCFKKSKKNKLLTSFWLSRSAIYEDPCFLRRVINNSRLCCHPKRDRSEIHNFIFAI